MDSSLNEEEESHVRVFHNLKSMVVWTCKYSVFIVIYGGGTIHPPSFRSAMLMGRKCETEPFKIHFLKDNVFHLISASSQIRDYVLNEDLGNFDNRLLLFHPLNLITQEPPADFDSAHFNFCITSWYYTLEIGLSLASVLRRACFSRSAAVSVEVLCNSSGFRFFSWLKKPLRWCILV